MRPSLAEYAATLALAAGHRSEDPHRKVGAAVLGHAGEVLALGYNGPPSGINLTAEQWGRRDVVRAATIHAEANALRYVSPGQASLLASSYGPCAECLKATAAQGIRHIVFVEPSGADWRDDADRTAAAFGLTLEQVSVPLTIDAYQRWTRRTRTDDPNNRIGFALGLNGEAGEVAEIIKKEVLHGRAPDRAHLIEELGDVLWYLARLADEDGITMAEVIAANQGKLEARYPNGFTREDS